jgi:CPA2 family monovalent cation:H+ antiporter-2
MPSSNLDEILILLIAAIFIVAIFKHLNLSPVLGYLAAGIAIGPHGLGIINQIDTATKIAEFGVVFLLFQIGLELTFKRLKSLRKHVFGFGTVQFLLTSIVIGLVATYLGTNIKEAIIIGGGLALSSTAIVLKVLTERGEQSTQVGRLSLAVLILQDLAVVPLLVMVTILSKPDVQLGAAIAEALIQAVIVLAIIIGVGRLFLRPLFATISSLKSQELFTAATLLVVLGASWATEHAGLTLALGAFLAGLLIAETEFRHQVQADILPYKSLLIGLFFMTVGMQLDFSLLESGIWHITYLALMIILIKMIIIISLCRLFRFSFGAAIHAGLLLSQGSEFAFILFALASETEIMTSSTAEILMVAITLSMAVTPLFAMIGKKIHDHLLGDPHITDYQHPKEETRDLEDHIIVAGFGRVGRTICSLLAAEKINYIALDTDAKKVHQGRQEGFPIYYGSVERPEVLNSIGIKRANSIIVAINERRACKEAIISIRKMYPDIPIIARAWDRANARELEAVGATKARAEAFESSLQLGKATLECVGVPQHEIDRLIKQFRAEGYGQPTPVSGTQKLPE